MIRTIISLDPEDKAWLERKARAEGAPMAEVVREAIRRMRAHEDVSFDKLLEETRGVWRKGDGLAWQRRLRREWP